MSSKGAVDPSNQSMNREATNIMDDSTSRSSSCFDLL